MREAYIVSSVRTPGCRRARGAFAQTRPEDLLAQAMAGAAERINIDKGLVDDIMTGCAFPEAEQGINVSRILSSWRKALSIRGRRNRTS